MRVRANAGFKRILQEPLDRWGIACVLSSTQTLQMEEEEKEIPKEGGL